jgi:formate hydrogenlyase subunit 3/multisubunit Na+/H+ antiporter MnhD subunit
MTALLQPIGIFLFGIGGGFLIPLLYRLGKPWLYAGFFIALIGLTLCSLVPLIAVVATGTPFQIYTAGAAPPVSINLRFGLAEGAVAACVNAVAILLAVALWERLKASYVWLLLFLLVVMGINGMIMTRDLFNLFVFLEIVSVGTYGLLGMATSRAGVAAGFKYVIATVIASNLFLLGAILLYQATGHLNIELLTQSRAAITGPIAGSAIVMLLACLIVELKPWPANGWALDVYETAPPVLAAFLSVCASAGMLFALWNLMPLFGRHIDLIVFSAALTFVVSNLIGLRQEKTQRLLGYSSIGQMALMLLAIAALTRAGADEIMPLIAFGLFVNHLLAKAGLFCLAKASNAWRVSQGLRTPSHRLHLVLLALFIVAIAGLPPFPGFWAKWELVMRLAAFADYSLIAAILAGSLLEATYLFRWFIRCLAPAETAESESAPRHLMLPILVFAGLLVAAGVAGAFVSGVGIVPALLPVAVGAALALLEGSPARVKGVAMLTAVVLVTLAMPEADGLAGLFAALLLFGGVVIAAAGLHRAEPRPGNYPLMAVLLLAIQALVRADTGLAFYIAWEFVTLSSFLLIAQGRASGPELLRFLVFSLAAAFLLLAGFAIVAAQTGSQDLSALTAVGLNATLGIALMTAGFLVKAAALGVHVWLPGAYADAPDDVSAMLSAVVSKAAIFGLMLGGYAVLRSGADIDFGPLLAWVGMATTVAGALMALSQTDVKRLLAYSSMSQLGYIVTAIGLMSHLGWVTALYLVASHMLVKGILFLAVAGVMLRCAARRLDQPGGLLRAMPVTAATTAVALLSMSGLPPLMGFGAKWLLLSAMMDKGWTALAVAGGVATFLGLWYMLRLFAAIFLGRRADTVSELREAPVMMLLPQAILIGGILVLSLFPKLLMEPVSAAIDPQFAATLVWEGQSLETIYGIWNPLPVMLTALAAAALLGGLWWLAARSAGYPSAWRKAILAARPLPSWATPRLAQSGWAAAAAGTHALAERVRGVYTGNGQTYALIVLAYFLVLYFAPLALPTG